MRLVLASSSPRRRMLLEQVGVPFDILAPDVDEDELVGRLRQLRPEELTVAVARAKAEAAAAALGDAHRGLILAADTVVVIDGEVLGKPQDADHAAAMLSRLQGRTHHVVTGVVVLQMPEHRFSDAAERTTVRFRSLTAEEIRAYIRTGEPMDKAGSYGVQGMGAVIVTAVEGCYFNVVGLPLALTYDLLRRVGYDMWTEWRGTA